MKKEIQVLIKTAEKEPIAGSNGEEGWLRLACPDSTELESLVHHFSALPSPVVAVKVNNEILSLSERLEVNASLEPVLLASSEGAVVYRNSLAFLLAVAAGDLFPERSLYIGHSLGRSYYYTFLEGKVPEKNEIENLQNRMRQLVKEDLPIMRNYMAYAEAMEVFRKNHQVDTALLLEERSE